MEAAKRRKYNFHQISVKQLGDNTIKICQVACTRISGIEDGTLEDDSKHFLLSEPKKKKSVSNGKSQEHISRAKTRVRELVICNEWDWWCTFTIDPKKLDRYDLQTYNKALSEFIHNYNRRCDEEHKVKYLLVPEKHQDGAWHMHGFIKGIRPTDLYRNSFGYMTWKQYEQKFGFISMGRIKDIVKASSYVLKYISKDLNKTITAQGAHLYYASKSLKQPELLFRGSAELHAPWDYEHPDGYCKLKYIDTREIDISEILEIV